MKRFTLLALHVKRGANSLRAMTVEIAAVPPAALDELLDDVRVRIRRARARIDQGQLHAARALLAELEESLGRTLRDTEHADGLRGDTADRAGLTRAELRILPYLRTHLTLAQIGEQLFVSRNTVSSQTASVYRKLGVGARAAAVEEAVRRGLLPAGAHDEQAR